MIYFIRHNMAIMSVFFVTAAFGLYASNPANITILPATLIKGMFFLKDVLIYVAALEILKYALGTRQIFQHLSYDQDKLDKHETRLLALVSAFPFGLGVSSFLKGLASKEIDTKPISEGMTSSMLIYPTTLASGFVFDSFGLTSISSLFVFGLPVVLALLLPVPSKSLGCLGANPLLRITLFLGISNYIYLLALSHFVEHQYLLKQSLFFVVMGVILNPKLVGKIPQILWGARLPLLFFICVGMLGHAFIGWMGGLNLTPWLEWVNIYWAIALPIFAVPLLSILFIHPLVLFIIFNPVLSPLARSYGVDEFGLYVIWIVMLINAQLLSPVSLTTVLSVANSNSNIFSESFLKHFRFAFKVSLLGFLYVLFASTIL